MPITDGYATLADLKSRLKITDAADDAALELAIEAASRTVDGFCHRFFFQKTDQTRYFTPRDWHTLRLGVDLVSVTTLKSDDDADGVFENTWTANVDYILEPLNAALESKPYTRIQVHPTSTLVFPKALIRSVEIVGTFGWSAVPTAVKEATEIQASEFFKRNTEGPQPDLTFEGGQARPGPSKFLDRQAQLHVQQYRKLLS